MSTQENKERGAASIHIALSNGMITVRHTEESGYVLAQWTANSGDWDKLWERITELKENAGSEL